MRVLQINTTFKTGGSTGRIAYDLRYVMESWGVESYVAFGYGYDPRGDISLNRICSYGEVLVSKICTKFFGHHGFYNTRETRRLLHWIDEVKPDLIHMHNIHNHYVNIELLLDYIAKKGLPCVLTMHDCWTFTGHCAYFDYSGCDKWKTGCIHCPSLIDYPKTFAPIDPSPWNFRHKEKLFRPLDITLVSPSRWLAEIVGLSFLKDKPCLVINNGVDTSMFKPCGDEAKKRLGIDGKKMLLAMASGFNRRKGIEYLLQIPAMLSDDEILVVVGVNPKQMKLLPKANCIAIERTNNVGELAEYYSAADVFVNTTLEDNFPTTNIESLSCGTPVVTFNTGGSVESVVDGETTTSYGDVIKTSVGMVVSQRDMHALLSAAREVFANGKSKYQENCRTKALQRYEKTTQYGKYIALYESIIDNRR